MKKKFITINKSLKSLFEYLEATRNSYVYYANADLFDLVEKSLFDD